MINFIIYNQTYISEKKSELKKNIINYLKTILFKPKYDACYVTEIHVSYYLRIGTTLADLLPRTWRLA